MRIALIDNNGNVANIIDADMAHAEALGYAQCIDDTSGLAVMHGTYANGVFTPPPAPIAPTPPPRNQLTRLEFLLRMTPVERTALRAAQASDPVITDAVSMIDLAEYVDVTDPNTVAFVNYAASKGYFATDRVSALLAPETA